MVEKKVVFQGRELDLDKKSGIFSQLPEPVAAFLEKYYSPSEAFEVQTSGSTGTPKKIKLKKEHMRQSALKTIKFLNLKPLGKALLCLSAEHIAGIMMLVRWVEGSLDLYYQEPTSEPFNENSLEVDFAAMVPLQVHHCLPYLSKVQKLIIGGAAVPADLAIKLKGQSTEIYHTYGMTETISHIAMRKLSGKKADEEFHVLPGVAISTDNRSCLNITAEDIGVQDLQTNDVVEIINQNSFIWRGRNDNVVNSGGVKLYPEELEKKIGDIGCNYFLAGIPDEKLGEKLVLVAEWDDETKAVDLQQFFKYLGPYEKPRAVYTLKKFATTSNGKLLRNENLLKAVRNQ